jgi:hypothetical protein
MLPTHFERESFFISMIIILVGWFCSQSDMRSSFCELMPNNKNQKSDKTNQEQRQNTCGKKTPA